MANPGHIVRLERKNDQLIEALRGIITAWDEPEGIRKYKVHMAIEAARVLVSEEAT